MNNPTVTIFGKKCTLEFGQYATNNTLALTVLHKGEEWWCASVNWEDNFQGANYEKTFQFPVVVIKNYSENEGIATELQNAGVIEKGGAYLSGSGGTVEARMLTAEWQTICKAQLDAQKVTG